MMDDGRDLSEKARMKRMRRHQLTLHLAQQPAFCCCCLLLGPRDAMRARRVFRLVSAITRDW